MTLARLHQVIQVCMDWDESESHQFLVGKIFYQPGFGIKNMKRDAEYDEKNFELHQLEEGMQFLFTYLYDGGEGWELQISLEEIIKAGLGSNDPILLDGERACPPEDVGGVWGYEEFLEVLVGAGDVRVHYVFGDKLAGLGVEDEHPQPACRVVKLSELA